MRSALKTSTLLASLLAASVVGFSAARGEPSNGAVIREFAADDGNGGTAVAAPDRRAPGPAGESPGNSEAADFVAVEQTINALSRQAERAIGECSLDSPDCVADVLDIYAADLEPIAPQLPPQLQSLPDVVATASWRVRNSQTKREAVQALKIAIGEVRKAIALIRADDPVTRKVETREGALVAETFQVADNKLEKAVGL